MFIEVVSEYDPSSMLDATIIQMDNLWLIFSFLDHSVLNFLKPFIIRIRIGNDINI